MDLVTGIGAVGAVLIGIVASGDPGRTPFIGPPAMRVGGR